MIVARQPTEARVATHDVSTPNCCESTSTALLLLVTATLLIPIWWFHYFPTTDGPAHLGSADVLLHYHSSDATAYRQYYTLNFADKHKPFPNAMGHWLLAALLMVFPPLIAEKMLVSAIALFMPLAAQYAIGGVRPQNGYLAFLAIPLAFNYLLHQGFYNFSISVVVYLFVLGYWLRRRETMTLFHSAVLFIFGLLLYACHLFALNMMVVTIGAIAGWLTLVDLISLWRGGPMTRDTFWQRVVSRCVLSGVPLLPTLVLGQRFHFKTGFNIALFDKARWISLLKMDILVSYRNVEQWAGIALAVTFLALTILAIAQKVRNRAGVMWDGLLLLPLATLGIYVTHASVTADIFFIPKRLILFFYLGMLLWLGGQCFGAMVRRIVPIVGSGIAIFLAVLHTQSYAAYNPQMAEFVDTLSHMEARSAVLPLMFSPRGYPKVSDDGPTVFPFYMAADYVMIEKKGVDLRNYEAAESYFPIRFRESLNPYEKLGENLPLPHDNVDWGLRALPQRFDVAKYEASTATRVDYIMIWAIPPELRDHPDTKKTFAQLEARYEKVFASPSGRSELWRRKH